MGKDSDSDSRPARSLHELRSAAKRLRKEWQAARFAATGVHQAIDMADLLMTELCLDAFLLHARNLRDFFSVRGRPDAVLARDFLSRPIRVSLPLLRSPAMRCDLNRRIARPAFVTTRRESSWNVSAISEELDAAMEQFAIQLRMERPEVAREVF